MTKTNKKDREYVNILGINITSTPKEEVLTRVKNDITHNKHFSILTPNSEQILMAQKNSKLKNAINNADYAIPDTIGLSQASRMLSERLPKSNINKYLVGFWKGLKIGLATFINKDWLTENLKPIKGREMFIDLINTADQKKWKVFFLGGQKDEAFVAADKLLKKYKHLKIATHPGPKVNQDGLPASSVDGKLEKNTVEMINKLKPQILFVAFGNPKQEIWIDKNLKKVNANCVMAVGGTFRYIAGISKLPPKFIEQANLEWFWRLLTEPYRLKRVINAAIVFPWKVYLAKINE